MSCIALKRRRPFPLKLPSSLCHCLSTWGAHLVGRAQATLEGVTLGSACWRGAGYKVSVSATLARLSCELHPCSRGLRGAQRVPATQLSAEISRLPLTLGWFCIQISQDSFYFHFQIPGEEFHRTGWHSPPSPRFQLCSWCMTEPWQKSPRGETKALLCVRDDVYHYY